MNSSISPSEATPRSIAIIGGGIAGLTAAYYALQHEPNLPVTIFEASPGVGGTLQTIQRDGFLVERSADNFLATDELPQVRELAVALGLEDQLIEPNPKHRRAMIVRGDRMIPVPLGFQLMAATRLWPLLMSPALPLTARVRVACERFVPPKVGSHDESITDFITRRIGQEAFEYLAQPLVAGIYSADPDALSAPAAIQQYMELEKKYGSVTRGLARTGSRQSTASGARYAKFKTFRGGMSTLVDTLESKLRSWGVEVRCGTPVTGLEKSANGWLIRTQQCTEEFSSVVVACSARSGAKITATIDRELASALEGIPYTNVAVVSIAVPRAALPKPLRAFGVVVPRRENRSFIAASFASVKFPGRAPKDHELVRVFLGGALQPELARLPAAELGTLAQSELQRLLSIRTNPMILDVAAWHDASPQYNLGHLDRMEIVQQRLRKMPGLALAGSAYNGVGLPQCVRSGRAAAERLFNPGAESSRGE